MPYGAFPSSDGWVFLSAGNDQAWNRLCESLDAPQLLADTRFASNEIRTRNREDTIAALSAVTQRFSGSDLLTRLTRAGVPCSRVNSVTDIATDPQALATGMLSPLPRPDIPELTVLNSPMTFDGAYGALRLPPPALGADSVSVLRDFGLGEAEIQQLIRSGVVGAERSAATQCAESLS